MAALPQDFDLNLLRVFAAVYETANVTRAADKLDVSQSAVSNALARLRKVCGDELFVRTPDGMSATAVAKRLAPAVLGSLESLDQAFSESGGFDAATSKRQLVVRMNDIGEVVFLPTLLRTLARQAPFCSLKAVSLSSGDTAIAMARGDVDLAIGFLPELREQWYQQRLFEQHYVLVARKGHKLLKPELKAAALDRAFVRAEHVLIDSAGSAHNIVEETFRSLDIARPNRITMPSFLAAMMMVAASDVVATVPAKLAEAASNTLNIGYRSHPVKLPVFRIHQYWHPIRHKDPACTWLRGLINQSFAEASRRQGNQKVSQ
jgi:DNA-binding transcriptional LysR family regulator